MEMAAKARRVSKLCMLREVGMCREYITRRARSEALRCCSEHAILTRYAACFLV